MIDGGMFLVMSKHVIKGIAEVISTLFDLELLSVDLILNVINSLVQLGNVHLSILKSAFSNLVLLLDLEDFVLELLLTLNSLLGRLLKLLHVLTNNLEFFLNALQLILGKFSTLQGSSQFILLDSKLSGEFIKLLFIVSGHLGGLSQVFVVLLNGHLIVHALALKDLGLLEDRVGFLGLVGQPGDGIGQGLLGLLGFLLHQHDSSGQGGDIGLNLLVHLLLFLKGLSGLGQLVIGLIKSNLKILDFLSIISDITISLVSLPVVFLGSILKLLYGGIETVSLSLQALHLLSDGIHGGGAVVSVYKCLIRAEMLVCFVCPHC